MVRCRPAGVPPFSGVRGGEPFNGRAFVRRPGLCESRRLPVPPHCGLPAFHPSPVKLRLLQWLPLLVAAWGFVVDPGTARGEAVLQYFNTDWREITARMPELAEAGYGALWVPPPTKGSGGLSVGYDLFDRFDLGGKDQRGTVRTRYGTEADLQLMLETAHRFGIRVYLDNIVNHNSFDVPGYNAATPIDIYPGFVPEDFHLRITEDGFYRKWDNTRDWNDAWQVQNLGLADLIDIAQESPNTNHGRNEGDDIPKISFVRHPNNPEYYLDTDLPITVSNSGGSFTVYTFANKEPFQDIGVAGVPGSAGNGRFDWNDLYFPVGDARRGNGQHDPGEPSEPFTDTGIDPTNPAHQNAAWGYGDGKYNMGNPVSEDVNAMLIRSGRWILDRTHADGFRLDAVKHVPDYFFGQQSGADKDKSSAGYLGQAQEQFNLTRGYSDWDNHRDSVFDTEVGRDDAMMFGEHLGEPPGYSGYFDAGMRLVDNPLRNNLNDRLGNPSSGLQGLDQPGGGGFAPGLGVTHAQSHDNDYASRRELQHAFYLTRAGLPLIYTDGNNHAGILGASGGAFPRIANTNFLGQYGDGRIPNLLYIHNHFARGYQVGRWSDADFVAYERLDKRENGSMSDADGATMLFMMNDNYTSGQARALSTSFSSGAYLYNYSTYGGGFYKYAGEMNTAVVPPGGYFAFSWRSPEQTNAFAGSEVTPITIQQNGAATSTMTYERKDGRDGDPGFNPYALPDSNATDYKYSITVPRITDGTNLKFIARADGSAENILMELDGGVDINSQIPLGPTAGEKRDNPPGVSTDTFLGYEQMQFVRRTAEKFAAVDTARNVIGSPGAETYRCTIGTAGFTNDNGGGTNSSTNTASYVYHDPTGNRDIGGAQFSPAPQSAAGAAITVQVKAGYQFQVNQLWLYYTTDGSAPEGSAGTAKGTTQVLAMAYTAHGNPDGSNVTDWWTATLPALPGSTVLRYKIGALNTAAGSVFPAGPTEVDLKKRMETVFQIANFNATTAAVRPHNDYGEQRTGLAEGFHVLRARAFLSRSGRASIYNTWTQTFYYDAQTPGGEIKFPANNGDTVGGQQYGVVIRADPSVTEVWVHIDDSDSANNDSATGVQAGNGGGSEPFTDSNNNGVRDANEPFTDINGNGVYDANLTETWTKLSEVSATGGIGSQYGREWRYNYRNIPSSGTATIKVRLIELSSSHNMALSPAAAHVTELVRTVNTAGPDLRMFIAYPGQDGQIVGAGYVMKVRFSADLANGLTETQLRNRISVKIASSDSGSLTGAVLQTAQTLPIIYNAAPGFHDFQFALPNLYNGIPDFLHTIEATMTRPSPDTNLVTNRAVRAAISQPAVFLSINNPPEVDSDGKKYQIVLPAVASPTAAQRSFPIEVETGFEALGVSIAFDQNAGTATLIPPPETALTGAVSVVQNGAAVTGSGTKFTEELSVGNIVRIGGTTLIVAAITSNTSATFSAAHLGASAGGLTAYRVVPNPRTEGNHKFWRFLWSGMTEGAFTFTANVDTDGNTATTEASATRNATVIIRQVVTATTGKSDNDDDGLSDIIETTPIALPTTNSETWTNGQVHLWRISGLTQPLMPDTDGDGLSDGLELGWTTATGDTSTTTDTDGDGIPNFRPDLDPPIFNTLDNATAPAGYEYFNPWPYNLNKPRTDQIAGTMTNPNKPDTDDDGLNDGIEDANRNGRVEIGLLGAGGIVTALIAHPPTIYNTSRIDVTKLPSNAVFLETDPNNPDTDGDGIVDGNEDANHNGRVDLVLADLDQLGTGGVPTALGPLDDSNALGFGRFHDFTYSFGTYVSNRVSKPKLSAAFPKINPANGHHIGVLWLETDPLDADTDGDGLPDGWEIAHGLDPFDDGIPGHKNMRTGLPTNPDNGATGDPDGDGFTNTQEFANGTDPRSPDTGVPSPAGAITIGPGTTSTVGGVTNRHEFTDWTIDDLIALDEYDGDGPNHNGGDVYHDGDGFDTSRDIVAFYAHDGGAASQGGDGTYYFRVDLRDLQAYAEDGHLDIYVVIDTNSPNAGEYALPDDVDTGTTMRWEAVVACYSGNNGRVYIDTDHANNSTTIGANLAATGVIARDQNTPNGFKKAYFNSELDAVEFSISRQALLDAGWNGLNADDLNFQVFTTKDGTTNNPVGPGDIAGRSDIRDTIGDDYLASDYYADQAAISGNNSVLHSYFGRTVRADRSSDRGKRAKVISLIHGNQAIQPGSTTQALINNAAGAGYYRPLDVHQAYGVPVAMHITPTLASSIQWAKVDPLSPRPYKDGPALNTRIKQLAQSGVIDLLGSTFADHVLSYFSNDFNTANVNVADQFLTNFYADTHSAKVFWNPERVTDSGTLAQIGALGFDYTFIDQMRHVLKWFGRNSALGDDGYRINDVNGVKCFVINDQASTYRFQNTDGGLALPLRDLLHRKARSGTQDQVVVLFSAWEDFTSKANADAYDKNIRWIASHPWLQLVTPDQIASGLVDLSQPPDGAGDVWGTVNRGTNSALAKVAHDFIDHATQENYDHWYDGQSGLEESLRDKRFGIRTGVVLPVGKEFGKLSLGTGIVSQTWAQAGAIGIANLAQLAHGTAGAAAFETAFHAQTNIDLSKYSTGAYIYPDVSNQNLAGFAKIAQAQFRHAATYKRVETWAAAANAGTYNASAATEMADVDLDGENEYLLYNDRVFAVFERLGGRLTGAWVRDLANGAVQQAIGNPLSYAGSETEEEGGTNITAGAVGAYRTSGFKDWFATGAPDALKYVNDLYVAAAATGGWTFTSSDGKIAKTITLAPGATLLRATYTLGAGVGPLYVRFGLSPNLSDLLLNGQQNLSPLVSTASETGVTNFKTGAPVRAFVRHGGAGNTASFNAAASDRDNTVTFDTINLRNQAQTQQLEIFGGNGMTFALGLQAGATITQDTDGDGLPDWWETQYGLNPASAAGANGAAGDPDGDGLTNLQEFLFGTNPLVFDATFVQVKITAPAANQRLLRFPTRADRSYRIHFTPSLTQPFTALAPDIVGTGGEVSWLDDGSQTGTPPNAGQRFYKVEVRLSAPE